MRTVGLRARLPFKTMALFFDHPQTNARGMLSTSDDAHNNRRLARTRTPVPHHVCLRLVGGWLAALTALLALVFAIRWSA